MIGHYWSTGITVRWEKHPYTGEIKVCPYLEFYDDGWCDDASTQGKLTIRYWVPALTAALATLMADAQRLGIIFNYKDTVPWLYVEGDGKSPDVYLPANWKKELQFQARRLGWRTYS